MLKAGGGFGPRLFSRSDMDWTEPYSDRFRSRKPSVCLGFIGYGDIYPEVFQSWKLWTMYLGQHYSNQFDIYFADVTKKEQYRARNYIVDQADKCDFLLMLDDDHTPSDCPDMLGHFFAEQKPLQGGLYVTREREGTRPVIVKQEGDEYRWTTWDEVPVDGGAVDVLGGGCNWVDTRLLKAMKEPAWWPLPYDGTQVVFRPDPKYGLDLQLCRNAKKLGVEPWLNGKVRIGHVVHERQVLRPFAGEEPIKCGECMGIAVYQGDGKWGCTVCRAEMQKAA